MTTYGVFRDGTVRATVTTDDGERVAFIPPDPGNLDYAAYLAWVDEGNVAETLTGPMDEPAREAGTDAVTAT